MNNTTFTILMSGLWLTLLITFVFMREYPTCIEQVETFQEYQMCEIVGKYDYADLTLSLPQIPLAAEEVE